MTHAWSTMAASRSPRWLNGIPWAEWSQDTQNVTFLDTYKADTEFIDYASKCIVIDHALQEATQRKKGKQELI